MSHTETMSCNLPLLDGEDSNRTRLIVTELELENAARLRNLGTGDEASFNDMLCTAWGLLLRCYTGQDDVSFSFRQDTVHAMVSNATVPRGHQSTVRMTFDEQESLATCVVRAKNSYADDVRGELSLTSVESGSGPFSGSHHHNTHIWVQDTTFKDTQDVGIQKVSQLINPHVSLKTKIRVLTMAIGGYLAICGLRTRQGEAHVKGTWRQYFSRIHGDPCKHSGSFVD